MSNTLETEGKDQRGDNEIDASDDLEEEEDDDVHPELSRNKKTDADVKKHRLVIETVMSEDEDQITVEKEKLQDTDQVLIDVFDNQENGEVSQPSDEKSAENIIDVEVIDDDKLKPQYVTIAASGLELEEVDDNGNRITRAGDLLTDGYIYVGNTGHHDMETCSYIVTDRLKGSYITTAALRRSGLHPEHCNQREMNNNAFENKLQWEQLCEQPDLMKWIEGEEDPHSTLLSGCRIKIDESLVLSPFKKSTSLKGRVYTYVNKFS